MALLLFYYSTSNSQENEPFCLVYSGPDKKCPSSFAFLLPQGGTPLFKSRLWRDAPQAIAILQRSDPRRDCLKAGLAYVALAQ